MTLGTKIVVMKDGVIQQVDTPQNLYNSPQNLFVAGFIGSPQMNFIDALVTEEDGKVVLKMDEHKFVLPEAVAMVKGIWCFCNRVKNSGTPFSKV